VGDDFTREFRLAPYRYQMIRGIDFNLRWRNSQSAAMLPSCAAISIGLKTEPIGSITVDGKSLSGKWSV
jgi:hypothetical protein